MAPIVWLYLGILAAFVFAVYASLVLIFMPDDEDRKWFFVAPAVLATINAPWIGFDLGLLAGFVATFGASVSAMALAYFNIPPVRRWVDGIDEEALVEWIERKLRPAKVAAREEAERAADERRREEAQARQRAKEAAEQRERARQAAAWDAGRPARERAEREAAEAEERAAERMAAEAERLAARQAKQEADRLAAEAREKAERAAEEKRKLARQAPAKPAPISDDDDIPLF